MAILIPSFTVALKDAESNKQSLQIAASVASYFNSQVNCLVFGEQNQAISSKFLSSKFNFNEGKGNSIVKEIGSNLKEKNPDMLIVPVNQGNNTNGLISVSDANKIIDNFERIVLTVPESDTLLSMSQIVVPIDTSFETRQKVPYAVALAKAFRATIHIIGVSNDKGKDAEVIIKNYTRQVSNNIEEKGLQSTLEIRLGGNPTAQIIDFAKEKKAGLIMIMTEQETNFASIFSGKYSEQIIKNSPIPVLSIHPKDLIISDARL